MAKAGLEKPEILNKIGNVRIMQHWGAFANHCCRGKAISVTCVCVRACALAHMSACGVPGRVGMCMRVRTRVRTCSLAYPVCNVYETHYEVFRGFSGCTRFFDLISWKTWFSKKKILNIKLVSWFCLKLLFERTTYCHKCANVLM